MGEDGQPAEWEHRKIRHIGVIQVIAENVCGRAWIYGTLML
jgi:hypothetical protein